jgi:hypothetical protein
MKPLILDYQISRLVVGLPINYEYDYAESLNLLSIDGFKKPFIELTASDTEMVTQTRLMREGSDPNFSLSELATKTKVGGEKEDMHDMLLELQTKTLTAREKDD